MTDRFYLKKQIHNSRVARPVSSQVFAFLAVIAIAGALISCGFVISAGQHFEAVRIGYESEELRRQANQLEERKRQLETERARESSPLEIERRAKRLGLQRPTSRVAEIRRPAQAAPDKKK
ncbi:MAG TPA: hypothetical protein VG778_07835 [Blastocatellia bacterium]|jgi:hypothetical protein|nr:hypothetical protein [Blastocatellia bacterium]